MKKLIIKRRIVSNPRYWCEKEIVPTKDVTKKATIRNVRLSKERRIPNKNKYKTVKIIKIAMHK